MTRCDKIAVQRSFASPLRFLSEGATQIASGGSPASVRLIRSDGQERSAALPMLKLARSRGLVEGSEDALGLSAAGKAALRRWLAEPGRAFQDQHRDLVSRGLADDGEKVVVNDLESPLHALARFKRKDGEPWLAKCLVAAGDRLRSDFTRGQMLPGISSRWDPAGVNGKDGAANRIADIADSALAARARVDAAMRAVGPEFSGLLIDVCCFLKGLETVERERQWPQRSAKLMLRAALQFLDRHYHPMAAPKASPVIRRWGGEGYRPEIGA